MAFRRLLEGREHEEASSPDGAPAPHPPHGGGGRTPYPEYDVASPDKWAHDWDPKTRALVLDRIANVPERAFFSEAEYATLEAACEMLLPQQDRSPEERIPMAPYIDERLAKGEGDGFRYEGIPWDDEAYRLGLAGIEEASRALFGGVGFAELDALRRDAVLACVEDGEPPGESWQRLPAVRFFALLLGDVVEAYYSHPTAWNEIGFQGPASPRGHVRLGVGKRDPWEADETAPLRPEEREFVGG